MPINDPDSMTISPAKFDKLYRLVEELLDRAVLDTYDPAILAASKILVILDGLAYEDDEGGMESDFVQDELNFEAD